MTYEYKCQKCETSFDVIKSVKDIDVKEFCPDCESPAERQFVPRKLHLSGTKVQHAEFNPGLGCVVKNKYHKQEICKERGLVEVGSDWKSGDKMSKEFESAREKKREKAWEEI